MKLGVEISSGNQPRVPHHHPHAAQYIQMTTFTSFQCLIHFITLIFHYQI